MTEQEQIALFKRVQKRFHCWSERKCSGYVHGIVDEADIPAPQADMLDNQRDGYNVGYVYGFIDARGPDVLFEDWYKLHPAIANVTDEIAGQSNTDYRWWDR